MTETPAMVMCTMALNGLGMLLKSNPRISNDWIPTILAIAGAILYPLLDGTVDIENVVQGFIAALAAVGAHQTVSKLKNGKTNETPPPNPGPVGNPAGPS